MNYAVHERQRVLSDVAKHELYPYRRHRPLLLVCRVEYRREHDPLSSPRPTLANDIANPHLAIMGACCSLRGYPPDAPARQARTSAVRPS